MNGGRFVRSLSRVLDGWIVAVRGKLALIVAGMVALALAGGATVALAGSPPSSTTYTALQNIPVPPASQYAGAGGGDGWAVALSAGTPVFSGDEYDEVFNVFHHQGALYVECHQQKHGNACWTTDPEQITQVVTNPDKSTTTYNFGTSGMPGMYLDQNTAKLYVYATRSDGTGGVVCVDTTQAPSNTDPFCGFTALTTTGSAISGESYISSPTLVGNHWYAFNYYPGQTASGNQTNAANNGINQLLCFDVGTDQPCSGQPFDLNLGNTNYMETSFPSPAVTSYGNEVIVPVYLGTSPYFQELACFDDTAQTTCGQNWPVQLTGGSYGYVGDAGAAFPLLDQNGNTIGLCLPWSPADDPCFDLTGAPTPTPAGLATVITTNSQWDGPAVTIGPRVYLADQNENNKILCFDYSTGQTCGATDGSCTSNVGGTDPNAPICTTCPVSDTACGTGGEFPLTLQKLGAAYTVNPDPQRPTCIWVNADNGASQIQDFDAYTGGACGTGSIRVLASQFVAPQQQCFPTSWQTLQVIAPAPSSYDTGTITFDNSDGVPISSLSPLTLDQNGAVDLSGLSALDYGNLGQLPQFLITLTKNGQPLSAGTAVIVQVTWSATYDPTCEDLGATVAAPPTTVTVTVPTTNTVTSTVTLPGNTVTLPGNTVTQPGTTVTNTNTVTTSNTVTTTNTVTNTNTTTVTNTNTVTHTIKTASPVKPVRCAQPSGHIGGTYVGVFHLGMTQKDARSTLKKFRITENRFDNFCLFHGWGIRLGYPTVTLLATLKASERAAYDKHVVLELTANKFYSLDGVRSGTKVARVAKRLHLGQPFHVGSNYWYFFAGRSATGVLKVRNGIIQEIGLASLGLTKTTMQQQVFISSFDKF